MQPVDLSMLDTQLALIPNMTSHAHEPPLVCTQAQTLHYKTDMTVIMAALSLLSHPPTRCLKLFTKHPKHQQCTVTLQLPVGANAGLVSSHRSAGAMYSTAHRRCICRAWHTAMCSLALYMQKVRFSKRAGSPPWLYRASAPKMCVGTQCCK